MSDALAAALTQRDDLDRYGTAKRMLFALQLYTGMEDIHSIAISALTDGPDDKSCDLVHVDREARVVILAQGYEAGNTAQLQAPLNKASSLHQAVNWLFSSRSEEEVPERLRSAWRELHEALADEAIKSVEIWFVHNLPESAQVEKEINAAVKAAYGSLGSRYNVSQLSVSGSEIGRETLAYRYEGSRTPILVGDDFTISASGAFTEEGENWSALCASIPASWLHEQFDKYKDNLFSANIRGYLGSTRSQSNINNGIQATVRDQPSRFWAYNNGITALVHSFDYSGSEISITGIGIVNGAQTTGAIGTAGRDGLEGVQVLARFIKCEDSDTIQDIIRFNNRQNPTQAADFRSNDRVQTKLVKDFESLGVVGYNGGRRGGSEDVIRRPGENQLSATVAAQALASFHGHPATAYHEKGQIWEQDAIYSSVFPDRVTAQHIVFVCSLLRALEQSKTALGSSSETAPQMRGDQELAKWFGLRGAIFLAQAAIGASIESILGIAVPDPYNLRFKENLTISRAVEAWLPVTKALLALAPNQLSAPLTSKGGLRNRETVEDAIKGYSAMVSATSAVNGPIYSAFSRRIQA